MDVVPEEGEEVRSDASGDSDRDLGDYQTSGLLLTVMRVVCVRI